VGVSTRETTAKRQPCAVHGDQPAVETCASCGRLVCLDCAIPFRGQVLCAEDAALQLGDPVPSPRPPDRRPRRAELVAAILLGVAVLGTIPPWDRFGSLTGWFSAWGAEPDPWPMVASIGALTAGVVALWLSVRGRGPRRSGLVLCGAAALLGVVASARAIFGAPDYVDHTVAPYLTLLGTATAAILTLARLRRVASRP
jgi:hypothetical protein